MRTYRCSRKTGLAIIGLILGVAGHAHTYSAVTHDTLTTIAVHHFNLLVRGTKVDALRPEQVAATIHGSRHEDEMLILRRIANWHFYDPEKQAEKRFIFIRTQLHTRFRELSQLLSAKPAPKDSYELLGRIIHYLQDVTVPAHVVPVFHPRYFVVNDRFDKYPVDTLGCSLVFTPPFSRLWSVGGTSSRKHPIVSIERGLVG